MTWSSHPHSLRSSRSSSFWGVKLFEAGPNIQEWGPRRTEQAGLEQDTVYLLFCTTFIYLWGNIDPETCIMYIQAVLCILCATTKYFYCQYNIDTVYCIFCTFPCDSVSHPQTASENPQELGHNYPPIASSMLWKLFSKVELVSEVELVSGVWWCDLSVECPADTSPHTPHTAQPPHRPTLTAFLTPQSTVLCSISQVVWRMCCVLTARSVQCTAGSPECKVCTKLFAVHCASCAVFT